MKISLKVEKPIGRGFKVGQVVQVEVDEEGVAHDPFWFNRMRDAKHDGCVVQVSDAPAE